MPPAGRHEAVFGTPAEDARRRDFTVNALFYNIADFSIIDYVGGISDLKARVIRTIGDPEQRFEEVRRAYNFTALQRMINVKKQLIRERDAGER